MAAKLRGGRAHPPRTTLHATPRLLRAPQEDPSRVRKTDAAPPASSTQNTLVGPAAPAHRISPGIAHTSPMPPSPSGGGRAGPAPLDALPPQVPARPRDSAAPSSPAAARERTRPALGGQRVGVFTASGHTAPNPNDPQLPSDIFCVGETRTD